MRCAEQAVSVEVRVDLDSAVVVYRPAAGEERVNRPGMSGDFLI